MVASPASARTLRLLRAALAPSLLLLACWLTWRPVLNYDFVWDDHYYIVSNESLRSLSHGREFFTSAAAQKSMPPYPYRPIRTLLFALLTALTGQPDPALFHAASMIGHALAAILFYFLALRVASRCGTREPAANGLAMVIALGFAMHPVATETVAWAKSLDDVLATAFILAAFLAAWRAWEDPGKPRAGSAAGAVLFFGAALFSKESVAGLYPLFLFPLFLCGRPRRKPFALWFVGLSATLGVFLAARRLVLGHTAQVATPISGTYARTLLDMIPVARLYAVKLLGIPPFLPDYDFMQGGARLLSGDSLTGLALIGVFLALLVWACRQPRRRAAVWFGCLWLMLGLVPVSNVIPMMQYFAVRFAYLPLIGFLFVLGGLAQAMLPARPAAAVFVLLAAFWSARTRHELPKWRDEPALMDYACRHGPLSKRIAVNYLIALFNAGDASRFEEVMRRYGRQLEGEPKIRWLEARRLADAGHPAEALAILEPLSGELGREREFMGHLGILHALTGNRDKARACLEEAVRRWPSDAGAWANLGQVLTESGSPSEALAAWQEAARLAPTNASFWQGLLHAAWAATNRPAARQALTALIGLDPDNPEHRRWLEALER